MGKVGGKRPGAGRPKGAVSKFNEQARAKAAAQGITPLEYMLSVLRDERRTPEDRMDAAKAAAPYMHAKLQAIEHSGKGGGPLEFTFTLDHADPSQDDQV